MRIVNKQIPGQIIDRLEAGIVLSGAEVKAIRLGHADLNGAHARIMGLEAYLINAKIFPYPYARAEGYQETRSRKLLLHKKEILALKSKLDQGNFTLIPLALYDHDNRFKIELALTRGTKEYEKKKISKQKVLNRVASRELKERYR